MHYQTCIPSLMAQVRDLQYKNQELQRSHQEPALAVGAVAGILQSYGDCMTQILSIQAEQDALVRDYHRESKDMASSMADHLKMSNHNTAQCVGAVEALGKIFATVASRLDGWDRCYATPTGTLVVVLPPAMRALAHLNLCRCHVLSPSLRGHWARNLVFPVTGVHFHFPTTDLSIASIIRPVVQTLGGLGGGGQEGHERTPDKETTTPLWSGATGKQKDTTAPE